VNDRRYHRIQWRMLLAGALLLACSPGCTMLDHVPLVGVPKGPPPPAESGVLLPDGSIEQATISDPNSPEGRLASGKELFRQGNYSHAERIFHRLGANKKNPMPVLEEARFLEAECLRMQGHYPRAADTYVDLLNKFDRTQYKEQAIQRMYDIANYWLDDTRAQMREDREKKEGKRWMVSPIFLTFDRTKPFLDREGRAIEKLEQVRYHDVGGPLADKALFLCGCVKFFRNDFAEADYYFSQIHERHPNSELAPQAVELAIISKHLSTGGSDYDGRKVAEARMLVHAAFNNYPELADSKKDFLSRQLVGITLQQAEKDFKVGQFYERTSHPGSAYFCYEIVRRRYPGTPYAERASQRMVELRGKSDEPQQASWTDSLPTIPEVKWPWQRKDADLPASRPELAPAPKALPAGMIPPSASGSGNYIP
jgi:outer membrane protein assembly factor BamD (BamD/ComL family)